jgi:hypothetical protein
VPQSVRAGCVKTNFVPVAWHTVQSLPRSTWFGLWHSEHFEAAMSWQREHGTLTCPVRFALPPSTTAVLGESNAFLVDAL